VKHGWNIFFLPLTVLINDTNGKKIILYQCKHKEKMIPRDQIEKALNLGMKNGELEKRLKAFVKSDIIEQGTSDFRYQANSEVKARMGRSAG